VLEKKSRARGKHYLTTRKRKEILIEQTTKKNQFSVQQGCIHQNLS
jgi:hypothetical protein